MPCLIIFWISHPHQEKRWAQISFPSCCFLLLFGFFDRNLVCTVLCLDLQVLINRKINVQWHSSLLILTSYPILVLLSWTWMESFFALYLESENKFSILLFMEQWHTSKCNKLVQNKYLRWKNRYKDIYFIPILLRQLIF